MPGRRRRPRRAITTPCSGACSAGRQVVFNDLTLPAWLREGLVNVLYLITETGLWAQVDSTFKPEFKPEDGLFGMCESPRACPQIECIPVLVLREYSRGLFLPQGRAVHAPGLQELSGRRGSAAVGLRAGRGFQGPGRGYQVTMNPACYTEMVSRYWKTHGDPEFLKEFYPSVKKTTEFTMSMNRGPGGIIAMPDRKSARFPRAAALRRRPSGSSSCNGMATPRIPAG